MKSSLDIHLGRNIFLTLSMLGKIFSRRHFKTIFRLLKIKVKVGSDAARLIYYSIVQRSVRVLSLHKKAVFLETSVLIYKIGCSNNGNETQI